MKSLSDLHYSEQQKNFRLWSEKPALQEIYFYFYSLIKAEIDYSLPGKIVELGSGSATIKIVIEDCICTDQFPNPWIDQVENVYSLSFEDKSVSNIILFDVFHHLEYPGNALDEINRVLCKNGRLIIFEPSMSFAGLLVYYFFHQEPVGIFKKITPFGDVAQLKNVGYYAAQANAWRIFKKNSRFASLLVKWKDIQSKGIVSFAYLASGGYSKPQVFPTSWYSAIIKFDLILNKISVILAARTLITIRKI